MTRLSSEATLAPPISTTERRSGAVVTARCTNPGAAPGFVQRAVTTAPDLLSVVEMGGASVASDDNRVTEAAVRGFWKAYRGYVGL